MANFNKVILAGRLTRDPELSVLPNDTPVCEFGMAINNKWRSKDGESREDTCFVDMRIYGRRADVIKKYLTKGSPLLVEGRLKYDTWEAKDGGGKRSKLYVIVDNFEFMGSGGGRADGSTSSGERPGHSNEMPPVAAGAENADDIPF